METVKKKQGEKERNACHILLMEFNKRYDRLMIDTRMRKVSISLDDFLCMKLSLLIEIK